MIQILPEVQSFGGMAGAALGGGIQKGASKAADMYTQMALEKHKQALRLKNIEKAKQLSGRGKGQQPEQSIEEQFIQLLPMAEKHKGSELTPEETDEIWKGLQSMPPEQRGMLLGGQQQQQMGQPPQQEEDPYAYADALETLGEGGLAKSERKKVEEAQKRAELPRTEYVKQEYKSLPKFMEGIEATEDKIPIADVSIKLAEEAIEDPGKWAAFRDMLADKTGYEGFRSGKGAELTSAIKQYFLGDLASIKGGRPNQLIEQQLLDAYPRIGRDPISNQKIIVGMKMQQDIAREKVRVARDLEEKYLAKDGFLPPGFQSIVKKQLRSSVEKIEKNTIKKLTALSKYQKEYEKIAKNQIKEGETLMLSPDGEYEAIPKASFQQAKEQGYIKLK